MMGRDDGDRVAGAGGRDWAGCDSPPATFDQSRSISAVLLGIVFPNGLVDYRLRFLGLSLSIE